MHVYLVKVVMVVVMVQHGDGAFVLFILFCILVMGLACNPGARPKPRALEIALTSTQQQGKLFQIPSLSFPSFGVNFSKFHPFPMLPSFGKQTFNSHFSLLLSHSMQSPMAERLQQ